MPPSRTRLSRLSVQLRLALSLGLLTVLMLGAFAAFVSWQAARQAADLHARRIQDTATRLAAALDVGLFERLREVTNLAASVHTLPVTGLRQDDLDRLKQSNAHFAWIGITDEDGIVRSATQGTLAGVDVSGAPWWKAARQGPVVLGAREAVLLKPFLPRDLDGRPPRLLDVAAPIWVDGRTVGVVGAHLDWRWTTDVLSRVTESLDPADQVELLLFDAEGNDLRIDRAPRSERFGQVAHLVGRAPAYVTWDDGRRYLTAVVKRHGHADFKGLGWTAVVRQPEALVATPARRLAESIWVLGMACALALFGLSWWTIRRLLAPLRDAARRVDAEVADTQPGGDEVAKLSDALTRLVERLREREDELVALAASLEARVVARTKEYEDKNEELRGFTRAIGHDLRSPILSIGQLVEMARQEPPERRDMMLAAVSRECTHVGAFIDAMHARSFSDTKPLEIGPVSMARCVEDAFERLRDATRYAGTFHLGPLPDAFGDAVLLRAVWDNLLGNAIKYSAASAAPRIEVRAETTAAACTYVVEDNGVGFDAAEAAQLFDAFARLTTGKPFAGSGIGLSIVKRIVERHGGSVDAASSPGRTVFRFTLPLAPDAAA